MPPRFLPELLGRLPLLHAGRLPRRFPPQAAAPAPGSGHWHHRRRPAADLFSEISARASQFGNGALDSHNGLTARLKTGAVRIPHTAADTPPPAPAMSSPSPSHS